MGCDLIHGTICRGNLIARSPDGCQWTIELKRKTKSVNGKYEFQITDKIASHEGDVFSVLARIQELNR